MLPALVVLALGVSPDDALIGSRVVLSALNLYLLVQLLFG
ncbi:hypothetical protein GCM10010498_17140 [Streptomyces cavourensis]|nr:hypothetical protein GCM10010498_17140 [Streptomyces cavourensis]